MRTGADTALDGGTATEERRRISTPASTIGPWLPDGALGEALAEGLTRVEAALGTAVGSEHPFVREAAGHLMAAGGKRFRPMLALLVAQLGNPQAPEVVRAAVICELTHLATLYHDDVMDEAAVRRGAPSANSRWSNSIAILTGDLLFARASDLLADLGPEAVRIQARTFERLVTGQIRETVGPQPGEDPIAHYLEVLADKTGSLVATSARFGASFAGAIAGLVAGTWGWRAALIVPGVVALLAIYVRATCPESPYWVRTQDRKRRIAETLSVGGTLSAEDRKWYSKAEKVGNYALRLTWSDGHATGIYSWEHLRNICPCCK